MAPNAFAIRTVWAFFKICSALSMTTRMISQVIDHLLLCLEKTRSLRQRIIGLEEGEKTRNMADAQIKKVFFAGFYFKELKSIRRSFVPTYQCKKYLLKRPVTYKKICKRVDTFNCRKKFC